MTQTHRKDVTGIIQNYTNNIYTHTHRNAIKVKSLPLARGADKKRTGKKIQEKEKKKL